MHKLNNVFCCCPLVLVFVCAYMSFQVVNELSFGQMVSSTTTTATTTNDHKPNGRPFALSDLCFCFFAFLAKISHGKLNIKVFC